MVKRKFEQELEGAMACNSHAHAVSKKLLCKKQKLPNPPRIVARPIINMKHRWGDNPEINVRVILNPGANVLVLTQSLVGEYKISVVLWERAEINSGYDGAKSKGAGSAYTFARTLSLADYYTKEIFQVSPLQDDYDILMA